MHLPRYTESCFDSEMWLLSVGMVPTCPCCGLLPELGCSGCSLWDHIYSQVAWHNALENETDLGRKQHLPHTEWYQSYSDDWHTHWNERRWTPPKLLGWWFAFYLGPIPFLTVNSVLWSKGCLLRFFKMIWLVCVEESVVQHSFLHQVSTWLGSLTSGIKISLTPCKVGSGEAGNMFLDSGLLQNTLLVPFTNFFL